MLQTGEKLTIKNALLNSLFDLSLKDHQSVPRLWLWFPEKKT